MLRISVNWPNYIMKDQKIDWQRFWSIVIPSVASVIPGLGHLLLGMHRKGLIIMGIWLGLVFATPVSPYEVVLIPLFIFWIWQGYDVAVFVRKEHPDVQFLLPLTKDELRRLLKK